MKGYTKQYTKGVALLLAVLMAVASPLSVLAANPIVQEVIDDNSDLDYKFTQTNTDDNASADIALEVIEKNGNILTEIQMPDGTIVKPEAVEQTPGFIQMVDGTEKNMVHYAVPENGTIGFVLRYQVPVVINTEPVLDEVPADTDGVSEQFGENQPNTLEEFSSEATETQEETEFSADGNSQVSEPETEFLVREMLVSYSVAGIDGEELDETEQESESKQESETKADIVTDKAFQDDETKSKAAAMDAEQRANTAVTTFEELKVAIAGANDGDTIIIDGTIAVTEEIKIEKSITLSGGTLLKAPSFEGAMLYSEGRTESQKITLLNMTLDGNNVVPSGPSPLIRLGNYEGSVTVETLGNSVIKNNISNGGGAISDMPGLASEGIKKLIFNDGTVIVNNTNTGGSGGVIGSFGSAFDITMYGGTLESNMANIGGAILVNAGTTLKLYGGQIVNNTANLYCGGVCVMGGKVYISGDVNITNNTVGGKSSNLCLFNMKTSELHLLDDFVGRIGVSAQRIDFNSIGITNGGYNPELDMVESLMGSTANFFSDNPDYITRLEEDGVNHKIILGLPEVTYHLRGGTFTDSTQEIFNTAANQPITKPADPSFTDHAFVNWYSTADTSDSGAIFDFNTLITKDTDIYARWYPDVYSINFDPNGGTGAMDEILHEGGSNAVDLPPNYFIRTGYVFDGWNTAADGTGTPVQDQAAGYIAGSKNIILYAQWKKNTFTVSFDSKGGTPVGAISDVPYGDKVTAPAEPGNTGYAFDGWYKDEAYTDDWDFGTDTVTSDITLYAKWTPKEYTVKYNTQGGSTIADKTGVHFTDKNLLPADPVKEGFTFAGWKLVDTEITADTTYDSLVADDTVMEVTIDAQWDAKEYIVKYDTQGAGTIADKTGVHFADKNLLPAEPVKEGFTFTGWKMVDTEITADTIYSSLVADDTVMEVTLTAQWQVKDYTVNYEMDGGTPETIAAKTVHYTDTGLIPELITPTKDGYTFTGWKLLNTNTVVTKDTTYKELVADDTVGSVTLKAQWEIKKFTATWKTKDGEPAGSIQGGTQTENDITYKHKPVKEITVDLSSDKEEYVLVGWNYEYIPDGHTEKVTGFTDDYKSLEILGDTTFTAKFASTPFVQAAAVNGKITAAKGNTASEITGSTTNTAQVKFTKEDDIDTNPGSAAIKIAANIHHHLDQILIKDYLGHEYTFQASDTITGEYEVGNKSPLTKVQVNFDKTTGILLLSNLDTSLYVEVTFAEDAKYKVEFFTEKNDPASLVQTNGDLYTGNPVGDKPITDPVKTGYAFGGWSLDGTDTSDQMYDSQKLITDADIAYYAIWTAKEYQVSYDMDGGTAKPEPKDKTVGFFEAGLLPVDTEYAKTGYTFDGWSDGTQKVSDTTTYDALAADDTTMKITLKAQWKPIGYQVTFDKQAKKASGTMNPQDFLYDEEKELHGNGFTYPGYTFAGWADTQGGEVVYTDGQAVKNLTDKEGKQVTLYAVWNANGDTKYTTEHYKQQADGTWGTAPDDTENLTGKTDTTANGVPKDYAGFVYDKEIAGTVESGTITGDGKLVLKLYYRAERTTSFDSNGGNYTPSDQTINHGETLTKPTDPTKDGYDFDGWYYTDADGKEQKWDFKDPVSKDMELTAKWIAYTYEIEFQKNSTDAKGTMENQPFAYDEEKALTANAFTRSGYTFLGWAEETDGTVVYTDSQNVLNLTDTDGEKITLYAVWAAKGNTKYTVEHYKQKADGTWGSTADETENLTGKTDTVVSAVPKTYTGFLCDLSIPGTVSGGTILGDETLLLKLFYRAQHQLSFDSNGGDYTPDDQTVVHGEIAAEPKAPVKEGSDFEGWYYTDGEGKEQKWNFADPVNSALDLTAKWKLHTYNVAFDKNNDAAEGTMEDQVYSYGEKKSLTPNGYTYAGYTFAGWAGEKEGAVLYADMQEVMDLTKVKGDTVTLYAVWNANGDTKYTVEHYKQQADGAWGTVPDDTENLTGKTDTTANGVPKDYAGFVYDKEIAGTVESGTITGDGKLVLKLYYRAERTTSFDSNGGNYTPSDQTVNHGDPLTKPTDPTKNGYDFDGWYYTDADGKEQKWDFKDPVSKDMELTAKWMAHTYEIEFQKNSTDAKGTMENQSFVYDEEQALSTNAFTRSGYTFLGWAGAADGPILYTDGQNVLNLTDQKDVTITLYAVWAAKGDTKYTVEHYKQQADGTWGTTPAEAETLTGKTDTTVTAVPKEYAGFYFDPAVEGNAPSGTITGDGKLVLKLYYRAEHQVSFDSNGGDYTPKDQMITQGSKAAEPKAPGKEGSDFEGWYYTDADGKEQKWNFDDPVTSSLQLTAKWKLHTYAVVFDKNNEAAEGTMEDQSYSYGEKKALTENSYTYSGYTFAGWAAEKDGKVVYANQQEVADLTKEKDGTVTLYAVWNANGDTRYTVEHYKQKADGTWGDTPDETESLTGKTDTVVNVTPKSYAGYAFDSKIKGTVISGIIAGDGSLVLKAYYRMQVTVSFDSDGGNYTPENQKLNLGNQAVKPNVPSRSGYTFDGWYYGNTKWDFTEEVTKDMALKAHWTKAVVNPPVNPGRPSGPVNPARPVNPNRPVPPTRPTYTTKTVKTGDTTNLMLYGFMAGLSGLFLLGAVYGKRRRRKEEEQ